MRSERSGRWLEAEVGSAGALVERRPLAGGQVTLGGLAPGAWRVDVEAADGRSWSVVVELVAGGVVELGF